MGDYVNLCYILKVILRSNILTTVISQTCKLSSVFTPQPLRAVGVLFSPMVSGFAGGGKKFVRSVSQKP